MGRGRLLLPAFGLSFGLMMALGVAGCSLPPIVVVQSNSDAAGHGPPPHAPAHGYRHHHRQGVDLVFDARRNLYVVAGAPQHYYGNGVFYRRASNGWQASRSIGGPWVQVGLQALPPGLRSNLAQPRGLSIPGASQRRRGW